MIKILIILYVSVAVHELGHFIVAKLFKIKVDSVSLFMYPIFYIFFRGTLYKIGIVPLTGYVNAKEIYSQSRYKKIIYFSSGVFMNLLLLLLIDDSVLVTINTYLIISNLVPFSKSDGRNILESI